MAWGAMVSVAPRKPTMGSMNRLPRMRMTTPVITGTQAAQAMGMDPTRLIGYANEKPEAIHFPYQMSGSHMKIPRIPFLRFWGLTDEEIENRRMNT